MCDDVLKSYTAIGHRDQEPQKNDLAIVKPVTEVNEVMPNNKACDFSLRKFLSKNTSEKFS